MFRNSDLENGRGRIPPCGRYPMDALRGPYEQKDRPGRKRPTGFSVV